MPKPKPRRTRPVDEPALKTWKALNDFVRSATEAQCTHLITVERAGRKRKMFLLRLHSRFNLLRGRREKKALVAG